MQDEDLLPTLGLLVQQLRDEYKLCDDAITHAAFGDVITLGPQVALGTALTWL